jgi:hypothetical protein
MAVIVGMDFGLENHYITSLNLLFVMYSIDGVAKQANNVSAILIIMKIPCIFLFSCIQSGTGQPPEAPAPLAALHPVLIHDDHDLNS